MSVHRDGAIERVTLNRPDVRNAFDERMIEELTRWAGTARGDSTLRVVVLAGAGKVFSAGADAAWMAKMADYSHDDNVRDAEAAAEMFLAINSIPAIVIGRVHGAALGGGCGLAAVCDIVVAEDSAMFGFTETKLGILPAVISPYALAKVGRSAARELFLTGMRFNAARAKEIGLVHRVVPGCRARRGGAELCGRGALGGAHRRRRGQGAHREGVGADAGRRQARHRRGHRQAARLTRGAGRPAGVSEQEAGRRVARE